jgi:transposase
MGSVTEWVGIDVGKAELTVAMLPGPVVMTVSNDASGWDTLLTRWREQPPRVIVVEATGKYHVGAWVALAEAGLPVAVINPARTHAFARSEGIRTKTDHHDARLLARLAQQQHPHPTTLPRETIRTLQELASCRNVLVKLRVAEENRSQTAMAETVIAVHAAVIAALDAQIATVEQAIRALIATDAELLEHQRILQSTPGIGPVISLVLMAMLPELATEDAKKLAGLAGVAPYPRDSGTIRGKRMIGGGRPRVTQALYQMAFVAVRCNPVMRAHFQQLCQRCPPKVAKIACARRMLGILRIMIRQHLTWAETRVGQGAFLPQET